MKQYINEADNNSDDSTMQWQYPKQGVTAGLYFDGKTPCSAPCSAEENTKIKEPNGKLIAIDLDGTLCRGECWTEEACLYAEPIQEMIDTVNDLYIKGGHIIIYTARPELFRHETEYWLNKHKVRRHALVMGSNKVGADFYIENKAIRPEEL